MAYVRKTDMLVEDIKGKVRNMKDKALTAFQSNSIESGTPLFDAAVESAQNAAFRDAPELKGKLPDSWYKEHERVELQFKTNTGENMFSTNLNAPDHKKIRLPKVLDNRYYAVEVDVRYNECTELLKTWLDDANTRNTERGVIAEQYGNIEEQLRAFMGEHASLNSAIKEMPEIEMYVPEKYLTKLREATAPRTKKAAQPSNVETLGIDRDALASIAIAHRITA
jgi:hypothetical protein